MLCQYIKDTKDRICICIKYNKTQVLFMVIAAIVTAIVLKLCN